MLEPRSVGALVAELRRRGFRTLGPTVRDGAVLFEEIEDATGLPVGRRDRQAPGSYRLERRDDAALFGFAVGPRSCKETFLPPVRRLWSLDLGSPGERPEANFQESPPLALIGARACDLAAVAIQDRILLEGPYDDLDYRARRQGAFVVAVHCTEPAATCFCASLGTGPRVRDGFDLAMTECLGNGTHRLLVEAGSPAGEEVLAALDGEPATSADVEAAAALVTAAENRMDRRLETSGLAEILARNPEHPRWDEVAERCLACGNCTQVCPTCFCHTVADTTDLTGSRAFRTSRQDSCFTAEHSYIHGGSVRPSIRSRYRQWLTHKLGTWHAQFGTAGCVGCGRCITWCPVGIDLTEEARAIRDGDAAREPAREGSKP